MTTLTPMMLDELTEPDDRLHPGKPHRSWRYKQGLRGCAGCSELHRIECAQSRRAAARRRTIGNDSLVQWLPTPAPRPAARRSMKRDSDTWPGKP